MSTHRSARNTYTIGQRLTVADNILLVEESDWIPIQQKLSCARCTQTRREVESGARRYVTRRCCFDVAFEAGNEALVLVIAEQELLVTRGKVDSKFPAR